MSAKMKQVLDRNRLKYVFWSVMSVIVSISFPPAFLYCRNADEAGVSEVFPALLLFLAVGVAILVLTNRITHILAKSALITVVCMLMITHFSFLEEGMKMLFPKLKYWHSASIVIMLCLHIIYGINHCVKEDVASGITKVLCLVFGGLILINFVTSLPEIINYSQAQRDMKNALVKAEKQKTENALELPNVYLLIFDEYAGFTQMKEYYGYDNTLLEDFLKDNQFNVSYTSHNESLHSSTIQTNLVNLDYIVEDATSDSDKAVLRKDNLLFNILHEHGYQIQILDGGFYGGTLPGNVNGQQKSEAVTMGGETLTDILILRSIGYPIWMSVVQSSDGMLEKTITILADYMSEKNNLPQGDVFTLVYIDCPHQPFIVDENGQPNPKSQWSNWEDPQYYLGQYKYVTKQMLKILDNIVANDPESIIILQSDHGARHGVFDHFPENEKKENVNNILNALYFQGQRVDIEGLSGVNTIRTVLNNLFDMNYDMIPLPEWGFK